MKLCAYILGKVRNYHGESFKSIRRLLSEGAGRNMFFVGFSIMSLIWTDGKISYSKKNVFDLKTWCLQKQGLQSCSSPKEYHIRNQYIFLPTANH